jgi:hypothetical protein
MLSDFEIARMFLHRPQMCVGGEARALRDVLALVRGAAIGRYPPYGSGFLPGFNGFVCRRFKAPPIIDYHVLLLKEFGDKPLAEACEAVLGLLDEWKAANDEK